MTALLQNKLLTFPLAVAVALGIAAEGVSIYTNYLTGQKATADLTNTNRDSQSIRTDLNAHPELKPKTADSGPKSSW